MSELQEEMSFWDHLEALRWTLIRIIIGLLVFTIACLAVMREYLFDAVILAPCNSDFILYRGLCKLTAAIPFIPDFCDDKFEVTIINLKPTTQFFTWMSSSFWLALLLTFPYLVYEVWKFVRPALYEKEKKNVRWVFSFGTIMFFAGCAVGYFLVFPMMLRFLIQFNLSDLIQETVALEYYMDNFLIMIFIMGLVFEMPLISWLASQLGLLKRSFFNKYRRHSIVGLLVAAAFITPSGDPFTLACVFLPLYDLFELSAFFVKKAPKEEDEESTNIVKYGAG
jgi:sec-independent protein translocase protein TatC